MANFTSYNRYLAVAARVVRRSLKEETRLKSERRGLMDLRFAKWEVSFSPGGIRIAWWYLGIDSTLQNGKQGEVKNLASANEAAMAEAAQGGSQ